MEKNAQRSWGLLHLLCRMNITLTGFLKSYPVSPCVSEQGQFSICICHHTLHQKLEFILYVYIMMFKYLYIILYFCITYYKHIIHKHRNKLHIIYITYIVLYHGIYYMYYLYIFELSERFQLKLIIIFYLQFSYYSD